jgi:hypothetical protein
MRPTIAKRGARVAVLAATLAIGVSPASNAPAQTTARLTVSLTPEQLGAGTTIDFSFTIAAPHDRLPPPLTALELRYPANIGLITSGLGVATCEPTALEALGPEGCSPDSLMGYGSALVELPIGPTTLRETGHITTWMGPIEEGHLQLLFYADGETPVSAQLIFTALLREAPPPFGGSLDTRIPVIPTVPEGPDAVVIQMRSTIGPKHIVYYKRYHGETIPYEPNGLRLPERCPRSGFPFAATFTFLNGTHTSARTAVPCPR